MASPATKEKTRYPGIYRRPSGSYTYTFRDRLGKQRWGTARTIDEARRDKAAAELRARTGVGAEGERVLLLPWLLEWVERYHGTGRRGFREETRAEYRSIIEGDYNQFFSGRTRLSQLDARAVSDLIAWLIRQPNGRGGTYSDQTVRNKLNPLRAAMRIARAEGLVVLDPTQDATLPHRARVESDVDEDVRPLTPEQLQTFLLVVRAEHRLVFEFLAATGLRASELIGLEVRHLHLKGDAHVKVRQRIRRGKVGPLKSKYARRDVPLAHELVVQLRAHVRGHRANEPVFQTGIGTPLQPDNFRNRVIIPTGEEIGAPWCGWHTFRHTCASLLFDQGRNVVQVQRWLGHHSPSFTIDTYVHLFDQDLGEGLVLSPSSGVDAQLAPLSRARTDQRVTSGAQGPLVKRRPSP